MCIEIGMQWPFPSDFYPSKQSAGGKTQTPLEFFKYPSAHVVPIVYKMHPPNPSVLYPLWQVYLAGGVYGLTGTQFPSPSLEYPDPHS